MKRRTILSLILFSSLFTGCRSSLLLNPYANLIDGINDTHIYFDGWYNPRLDISRAGRPDWCGPINRRLGRNVCYMGCYDRYDDCNLYPPVYPYYYPGDLPEPTVWTPKTPSGDLPPPPAPKWSEPAYD